MYRPCPPSEFIKPESAANNRAGSMQNSIELIHGRQGLMIFKIKYVH